MKYIIILIVSLFAIAFSGLGFYVGRIFGAIIEYAFDIRLELVEYLFAIPLSVLFAILGGCLVILYIESTDFLSQKFAELIVGHKDKF